MSTTDSAPQLFFRPLVVAWLPHFMAVLWLLILPATTKLLLADFRPSLRLETRPSARQALLQES